MNRFYNGLTITMWWLDHSDAALWIAKGVRWRAHRLLTLNFPLIIYHLIWFDDTACRWHYGPTAHSQPDSLRMLFLLFRVNSQTTFAGGRKKVEIKNQTVKCLTIFCGCFYFTSLIIWKYLWDSWCSLFLLRFLNLLFAHMLLWVESFAYLSASEGRVKTENTRQTINLIRWLTSNFFFRRWIKEIKEKHCGIYENVARASD